ncbi:hypothetical protein FRC03_009138 [Tulasnella sp. 419]|nr:hypothetical protein FRC03_009138 [Tulasnella sp. 419]
MHGGLRSGRVILVDGSIYYWDVILQSRCQNLVHRQGMQDRELASAIKPLLPTASVSSIASSHPTPSGSVVGVLASEGDAAAEGAKAVKIGLGSIVGLDEPVDFDD